MGLLFYYFERDENGIDQFVCLYIYKFNETMDIMICIL